MVYVTVEWLNKQAVRPGRSAAANIIDSKECYDAWLELHEANKMPKNPEARGNRMQWETAAPRRTPGSLPRSSCAQSGERGALGV